MFEIVENEPAQSAVIKVVGIGGGGGNAVKHMIANQIDGVDFICANTDAQALHSIDADTVLQLGSHITKGLGAGANPEVGRHAAIEDRDRIAEVLEGADMVFITAGMGGGTGTGAAPIVAEVAKEMGVLTVAVVTKPFPFEGKKRMKLAEEGINELKQQVDSLITIPNEKLLSVLGKNTSLIDAFKSANDVLLGAVQGIANLIIHPGQINVDFADVKTVMSEMGMAMMGSGSASGDDRARQAAEMAIGSPLLEDVSLQGARGILVNITAGPDFEIGEFQDVGEIIEELASENATVVVGTAIDNSIGNELRVTVVATGLGEQEPKLVVNNPPVERSVIEPTPAPKSQLKPKQESEESADVPDYRDFDQPAMTRTGAAMARKAVAAGNTAKKLEHDEDNMEFLDIPAFLRRQAD